MKKLPKIFTTVELTIVDRFGHGALTILRIMAKNRRDYVKLCVRLFDRICDEGHLFGVLEDEE